MAKVYDNATDLITFARLQAQNTTSGSSYLGSDGLLKFAAEDEPRIEYGSDGSLKGLLIEEQRTNLVPYSEDFANAGWSKVGTVAIDSTLVTGPDGTLSGRRVLNFADAGGDRLAEYVPITNATLTGGLWVKGEGSNIGKDIQIVVKRSGGTFVGASVSHTLTADWVRLNATFTQDPTNTGANIVLVNPNNGNEASEVLVYGAQLEVGSFATSYIPTSGSQSTRSADVASIPVTAFGYNQDAGTVVVEFDVVGFSPDGPTGYPRVWAVDQADGKYIAVHSNSTRSVALRENESGETLNFDVGSLTENTMVVIAATFADDDLATSLDGATALTATPSYTLDLPTTLAIGSVVGVAAGGRYLNGHIKSLKYFPRRLTNTQLQELTA